MRRENRPPQCFLHEKAPLAVTIGAFITNYLKRNLIIIRATNIMKNIVLEQLSQRGLEQIYSEKLFKSYCRKIRAKRPYTHPYIVAQGIFDMFITNAPKS